VELHNEKSPCMGQQHYLIRYINIRTCGKPTCFGFLRPYLYILASNYSADVDIWCLVLLHGTWIILNLHEEKFRDKFLAPISVYFILYYV